MDTPMDMMKEMVENKVEFIKRMGLKVIDLDKGRVRLMAPITGNENHIGTMYAGALFTLGEVPGGALFLTSFNMSKYYPIVKEMKIRFRRPARTDVFIDMSIPDERVKEIEAETDRNGKAEFILEGEIKDESGEVVALTRGLYQSRLIGR
jgi:thioesterase domain-containing protein